MLTWGILLFKYTFYGSLGGLTTKVLLDLYKGGYLDFMGISNVKSKKAFEIGNEHTTVIGLTQHGKTYGTIKTILQLKQGVLFFNSQHTETGPGFITADENTTERQLITALQKGQKINYLPKDDSLDKMSKELGDLTTVIYKQGRLDFYFVIDEVQLFSMSTDKKGKTALLRLATTGLGRGFKCMFLSQRPAKVENTLYTQSTKHIIFALGKMDISYLKQNGFPVDEIVESTRNDKYIFVEFDQKQVRGPYKIG